MGWNTETLPCDGPSCESVALNEKPKSSKLAIKEFFNSLLTNSILLPNIANAQANLPSPYDKTNIAYYINKQGPSRVVDVKKWFKDNASHFVFNDNLGSHRNEFPYGAINICSKIKINETDGRMRVYQGYTDNSEAKFEIKKLFEKLELPKEQVILVFKILIKLI